MKVMGTLWPSHLAAIALRFFLFLIAVFAWSLVSATAQIEEGELLLRSDKSSRLALLLEGKKLATERQAIGIDDVEQLGDVIVTVQSPGKRKRLAPIQDISFADSGLTSAISFVIDPTLASAAEQVESIPLLLDALQPNQTLILVLNTPSGWLVAGTLKQGDTLEALDLSASEDRQRLSPLDYAARDIADRQFIVFADGRLALPEFGEVSEQRSETYFAISAGFAEPLPDGIYGLGTLDTPEKASELMALANSGSISVFEFSKLRRMPFEGNGQIRIDAGTIVETLTVDLPEHSIFYLINPLNIPSWLTTPGRRLFGLITTVVWTALVLIIWWLVHLPRRETSSTTIAEIELFYEGRTIMVKHLPFTIGRSDTNDLIISDEATSRHHAELRRNSEGELIFVDLGSANGSLIEGGRIAGPLKLGEGLDLTLPSERIFIRPGRA